MKVFGVSAKNEEQEEALRALTDESVELVVLEGVAGSGKTYLTLAGALAQVLDTSRYSEILFTRAPVSVGQDIGFLPGTEQEKMRSWCGGFFDNLEDLVGTDERTTKLIERKIKTLAMCFMRGRSLINKFLIIDEVQNLSTAQLKVLLTRVGENTKVVCLGDSSQIDNIRLTPDNNALSVLITAATTESFIRVVGLRVGVRSNVCTWAANAL